MGIQVKAKGDDTSKVVGYYDHRRRYAGETFTIETEQEFSQKWMERADGSSTPTVPVDKLAPYKPNVGEKRTPDPTLLHVPQPAGRKATRDER